MNLHGTLGYTRVLSLDDNLGDNNRGQGRGDCMNLRLIYYSPTGSTRSVLEAVAAGMMAEQVVVTDLTRPGGRATCSFCVEEDLVMVGVPVYAQRVPDLVRDCLKQIRGNGGPTVVICVYGNVQYGIALRELQGLCSQAGFRVIAGAAFVAQHSFSSPELVIAQGRPDARDIEIARTFGMAIMDKLKRGGGELSVLPGRLSWAARVVPPNQERLVTCPPVAESSCRFCGVCAAACPAEAIDPANMSIDDGRCIRCFACVRKCPVQARSIRFRKGIIIKNYLRMCGSRRREPELFI